MSLLDLQTMDVEDTYGGGGGDKSSLSVALCDTNSNLSKLLCL
jgi:Lanthionine-containing peptide SapB precursor RamS